MYNQVRDLLAAPEWRAKIDEADLPLLKALTQVAQEFCHQAPTTLGEPPLVFELLRDDDAQQYRLWFLYPPSVQHLTAHGLGLIYALGEPYVDPSKITLGAEAGEPNPRLALTVLVPMRKSAVVMQTTQRISVATTVMYHQTDSLLPSGGLSVRKLSTGTIFSNATGGGGGGGSAGTNNNKRARSGDDEDDKAGKRARVSDPL